MMKDSAFFFDLASSEDYCQVAVKPLDEVGSVIAHYKGIGYVLKDDDESKAIRFTIVYGSMYIDVSICILVKDFLDAC